MKQSLMNSLNTIIKNNKEGSYSTHANRALRLKQAIDFLTNKRFIDLTDIKQLKTKHIDFLVLAWKSKKLSAGTLKNRMSDLRWLSRKINKQNIVKCTNDEYGIERRQYVIKENKAQEIDNGKLEAITDKYTFNSLKLQEAFGLRREEAIKFNPKFADQGEYIRLKGSWTKGGRARNIRITNIKQRELLDELKIFARNEKITAMIPSDKNYHQQIKTYQYQLSKTGFSKMHGLRHKYAQNRYKEITGWECPKNGGKPSSIMSLKEKQKDSFARMEISRELGHGREAITSVYLGGKR